MKKIEYAVGAAGLFVRHMHTENFDHGMIATFGNHFRVEQGFTGGEALLHRALAHVGNTVHDEMTCLYDSIEDTINQFWQSADRSRPWLLTIITDGIDNVSSRYPHGRSDSPQRIGQFIATRYNREPSNFIFIIGVGEGNQIDKHALGTIGSVGGCPAITIAAFPLLELIFLNIAIQVSEQITGRVISQGSRTWTQVAQERRVSRIAFDYAFLIDRSGSMNEPG